MCVSEKKPIHSRLHPRIKGCMGLADELLLQAYTCVCGRITSQLKACTEDQKGARVGPTKFCCDQVLLRAHTFVFQPKKTPFIQGCTQGSTVVWGRRTNCCCNIHMCVWQNHMSTQGLHQGSKRYKSLADQLLRAYTYVRQKQFQVAPKDHRLHGTGRPTARICQVKVAPKGQGLQVFGRLRVAVSIHMCVAE